MMKGGSAFFLDTGQRVLGVTAAHVVTECLQDENDPQFVQCMVGSKTKSHPYKTRNFELCVFEPVFKRHNPLLFPEEAVRYDGRLP